MEDKRQPLPLELTEPFVPAEEGDNDAKTELSSNTTSTQNSASVNATGVQVDVTGVDVAAGERVGEPGREVRRPGDRAGTLRGG